MTPSAPETSAQPTKKQVLASSAGWVAVVLNVIPGLGAGYLYQRRWKPYWITSLLATTLVSRRSRPGSKRSARLLRLAANGSDCSA